jgi:hypothetical protein
MKAKKTIKARAGREPKKPLSVHDAELLLHAKLTSNNWMEALRIILS